MLLQRMLLNMVNCCKQSNMSLFAVINVGMGMAKEFVSDPSTMQKAFEYGSKVSEVVNEESKKDS